MSAKLVIPFMNMVKLDGVDVPVAVDEGIGPNDHVNGFLISRYYFRSEFGEATETLTTTSIKNMADHMRLLMNYLAEIGKHYLFIDGKGIESLLDIARKKRGTSENSLQIYLNTWRQFYEYLSREHVDHACIDLPPKYKIKVDKSESEKADDPYSHAKKNVRTIEMEPLVYQKRKKSYVDYVGSVLSLEENDAVLAELAKIDIVYAVMAAVQFQTLLRIKEIVHGFPNKKNGLNPGWKSYAQMQQQGLKKQELTFLAKGKTGCERTIEVSIKELEIIFKYYKSVKEVGDTTTYTHRYNKFITKYLTSKKGRKSNWTEKSDILWIAKSGNPVSNRMYQDAFTEVAKILHAKGIATNVRIHSHGQRHTGGTHALWAYEKTHKLVLTEALRQDIQVFLQKKYGHMSMATTLRYIKTAICNRISSISEDILEQYEERMSAVLENNCRLKKGVEVSQQKKA
jgi:site-specific recombinase XerC